MEKEREKRWKFLFERMYQADKSLNKPAFFDALDIEVQQALDSQMSDLRKEVEKMFSVYPDGGIHDFGPDEELVSKKQVLLLMKK